MILTGIPLGSQQIPEGSPPIENDVITISETAISIDSAYSIHLEGTPYLLSNHSLTPKLTLVKGAVAVPLLPEWSTIPWYYIDGWNFCEQRLGEHNSLRCLEQFHPWRWCYQNSQVTRFHRC